MRAEFQALTAQAPIRHNFQLRETSAMAFKSISGCVDDRNQVSRTSRGSSKLLGADYR
jgi:hypothetical protein